MRGSKAVGLLLCMGLAGLVVSAAAPAQEVNTLTMKIGKTCGTKFNELFVQVQDGPRMRVKPDFTIVAAVPPGTKLRVKQTDESVSIKLEGIWTEAVDGGELLTRCMR